MKLCSGWVMSAGLVLAATSANAQIVVPDEGARPLYSAVSDVGGPYAAMPPQAPGYYGPHLLPAPEVYTVLRDNGFSPLGVPRLRELIAAKLREKNGIPVETAEDVLVTNGAAGPASVVRRIDDAAMADAATRLARRFNLSGLFGLDYVRDAAGQPHLIEINPRATQTSHICFGPGRDLCAALAAKLGAPDRERRAVTGDAGSYQYLVESIRKFPKPNVFADMIRAAGFSRVNWQSLSGGIVALHSGWRL